MPTILKFRRGDTATSNAFTGAEGELFVDTSKDTVVVHDGVTAGGKPLATEVALAAAVAGKANSSSLAAVATTGSYNDLANKPSIPSTAGLATETFVNTTVSNLVAAAPAQLNTLNELAAALNNDASFASTVTSQIAGKQNTLISGTDIKTVNGTSILGSGNIVISGGSGGSADLTQVASDIAPTFSDVYDIGSDTNRFYDAYLGNKLDVSGATITGSSVLVPGGTSDTYDYTLASNATLVAPSVAVDTSLVGGLFTEGTTVTPEHILGAYTDTKGTITIDGSLKVNDDLSVRNSITLQQDTVSLGTIVSKDTSTSLENVDIATLYQPNTWYAAFGTYLLVDYDGRLQSSYGNFMSYPGFAGLTSGAVITINLVETGYTWTYTVTSVSHDGMYTNINYTPLSSTSPWSTIYAFNQATIGYSKGFGSGPMYGGYEAGMSSSSSVTTTVLALDKLTTALTSGIKLAINDAFASAPVNQSLSITGSLSSNNISNQSGSGYTRELYTTNGESWANLTTQSLINTKAIFTTGNQVSIAYNGQTGVYSVGATSIAASGYGSNTYYSFVLSFVSGYDFVQNGDIDYAFGMMGQQVNWSATVVTSVNYTGTYAPQLVASSTSGTKYVSTSSTFDWLNVGDTLSYVPLTTSIEFKKDDGTSVKAITYNNITGALSYGGLPPTPILLLDNTNIVSSNAYGVDNPADGNSVAAPNNGGNGIAIGSQTHTQANSVSLGASASSGGGGVAIGASASSGYQGVAIGYGGNQNSPGQYSVSVGYNSSGLSYNSIALGYNVDSYVQSTNPYYTIPGLRLTPKTRNVTFSTNTTQANFWLYVDYPGEYVSVSSTSRQFSINNLLNFSTTHAIITVEFLISTNNATEYWATGIKRYKYNNYMGSAGTLKELTAPVAVQRGTATYASSLDVQLINNGVQQELKIVTNASDTSNTKNVIINISVSLF